MAAIAIRQAALPRHAPRAGVTIIDPRFRQLLGEAGWVSLPPAVRARFGRKALATQTISYVGEVVECRMSRLGRVLAQLCRLVGAPLPLSTDTGVAAAVCVTEDASGGGQFWTRQYCRRAGFPQVIHSSKRFAGPTGLEEYLGMGFGIALKLRVEAEALYFDSDHYFWRAGPVRLRLPRWLAPGDLSIGHIDCDHGWFAFTLALEHPWFGAMIQQCCLFTEYRPGDLP
ncbi:MAG: hypothetical protein JWN66_171 [Sphingomonas bacterium]|uniref:DUF4166 domain-containing protein n=1 Tax=Sphingomonas bacterium TaxID=1895847 RepID=UPI002620AFB8|nr:DUF4166 domain-containing protein [Sphingomonas bacterium]MDB5703055.1 hypothetical protein [Sphingomonas bacterium]